MFTIKGVIDMVKALLGYTIKYKEAWKAKQATFKMLYDDWEEADNRLHNLLGTIEASNSCMYGRSPNFSVHVVYRSVYVILLDETPWDI
jgi:hypothetical protein